MNYPPFEDNAPGFNPFSDEDGSGHAISQSSNPITSSSLFDTQEDHGFREAEMNSGFAETHSRSEGSLFGEEPILERSTGIYKEDHGKGEFAVEYRSQEPQQQQQQQQQKQKRQEEEEEGEGEESHPFLQQEDRQRAYNQSQEQQQWQKQQQPQQQRQYQGPYGQEQPQAQQQPQNQHRHDPGTQEQQQKKAPQQYKLVAKITGLERTGRKDPILRFDVHVHLPTFRTTQYRDVRRTHSEFIKLSEHLISSNPECFVPAVPLPSTSAGVGTDEDEARVRGTMQRWLNYVCGNEILMRDEEMKFFVEADFGYSPVMRKKQPATGMRRKVIKQFAPPPDDTPELADARPVVKAFYLGTMETGQKVDKVVKARRGLGLAEADLGVKFHNLSVIEAHTGLANALRKLGKTIQQVGDYHAAQATAEATTLSDPLNYHSSDAFIVKETLTNRQILQRELHQAQANTRSKESTASRLRAGANIKKDKSDEAIAALNEARQIEEELASKVRRVTANLVQERRKWFFRTSVDLRASIRDYVLRQIEAERRLLATLESVRPDIRAIDSTGGLSRLGRDVVPVSRRVCVAASQGPKGDAWSGVQRAGGLNRSGIIEGTSIISPVNGAIEAGHARNRSGGKGGGGGSLPEAPEDDEDRLDAKNAASRLATSTF